MASLSALFLMAIYRSKFHHCKRGTLSSFPMPHCSCPSSWRMTVIGEAQMRLGVLELSCSHPLISFLLRIVASSPPARELLQGRGWLCMPWAGLPAIC